MKNPLVIALLAFAWACAKDVSKPPPPPSLAIDSIRPTPGEADVDVGTDIVVYFSRSLDVATIAAATLHVTNGGDTVPSRTFYDPSTHAARITAPLLPATDYTVSVTTGVEDTAGARLAADTQWSFHTHVPQTIAVDTGSTGAYTSLVIGPDGVLHVTYEVNFSPLKHAQCQAGCLSAAAWTRVAVDTTWASGRYSRLALDAQGGLHVAYAREFSSAGVAYAVCATNCGSDAAWQHAVVDSGKAPSWIMGLALTGGGGVAIASPSMYDTLRVALCAGTCLGPANWSVVSIAPAVIAATLIADQDDRLHLVYYDNRLWYATCSSGCTTPGGWSRTLADTVYGAGNNPSLVIDPARRLHVSYYGFGSGDLRYATCAAACTLTTSWTATAVDTAGNQGNVSALVIDQAGRIRIVHASSALQYSVCVAACTNSGNWRTGPLGGVQGGYLDAKLDHEGRLHVTYADFGSGHVTYLR